MKRLTLNAGIDGLLAAVGGLVRLVGSIFGGVFSMITLGVFMAALGLGGIFFMYGRDLPSYVDLASYAPKTISRIYSGEGRIIDEFASERRLFAGAEEIPAMVKAAFISAEDKNFYEHAGYDPRGMAAALRDAIVSRGRDLRGASTITQQVMKNFLLDGTVSAERKIKEIILATRIEQTLSKDQILELYLNEIFLGQNSYGVAAAAQTYFNKPLSELLPEEAAYLAAMPKAPSQYHPVRQRERAEARRDFVLREMKENGYISEDTYETAKAKPLRTVQSGDYASFRASLPPRDYFTDEIRRQLSRELGGAEFFSGGYSVRATIDPEMQASASNALREGLEAYDRKQGVWRGTGQQVPPDVLGDEDAWRAALRDVEIPRDVVSARKWYPAVVLSVDSSQARIGIEDVAEVPGGHTIPAEDVTWARKLNEDESLGRQARGPSDLLEVGDVVHVRQLLNDDGTFQRWSLRQVPEVQGAFVAMDVNTGRVLAMQGGFSYQHSVFNRATQALRQPGSSFKPFVYAAALDSGYTPATIVIDAPIEIDTPQGLWRPKNASDKFYGPTPVRTGVELSRNLMTIRLAQEIGMDTVASYAEDFGVYDEMGQVLAASLGSEETTLYKMVAAYAMFANGGERVEPTLVDRVQDRYGRTEYRHDRRTCLNCDVQSLAEGSAPMIASNRERVMDAITAYQLTSMMEGVVDRGTAARTVNLDVPVAGKTGTTNDAKDVWFVGFTSNIVAGCYIGYDDPTPLGPGSGGGSMCGPVFNQFMETAIEKYGGGPFEVPEGGLFINIDRFTGARLGEGAFGENVVAEYFREGEEPVFGLAFDGGFAMSSDIPLFSQTEEEAVRTIQKSDGTQATVGNKASVGALGSGGLY
ncbi:MAG: PBP1A family penicillin-binding protein [Pseudomonadota bacterium]